MVEGGNWGEVINSYFAETGLDPNSAFDALKMQKIKFGGGDEGTSAWMQRLGYVDEYGKAIAWLGSKANSYMTGSNVNIDGGSDFHY